MSVFRHFSVKKETKTEILSQYGQCIISVQKQKIKKPLEKPVETSRVLETKHNFGQFFHVYINHKGEAKNGKHKKHINNVDNYLCEAIMQVFCALRGHLCTVFRVADHAEMFFLNFENISFYWREI